MQENKFEAHGLLGELPNDLRELWLEIPGDCHLNCRYCLAFENKKHFSFCKGERIDVRNNLLEVGDYLNILTEFRDNFPLSAEEIARGVRKQIAIPAAGEPFFTDRMRKYAYAIINFCEENDISVSIFTTGDLINDEDIQRLKPLKNIHLIIKLNSFKELVQDKIVGKKGYAAARNKMLQRLIDEGFNDGRLGIVTSLIKQNAEEAEDLLHFARRNNLTFDMDLIISRGKGGKSHCQFDSNSELLKTVDHLSAVDKKEYGKKWQASPTYIGSKPCTRFSYHLYVQNNGDVSPCIGSTEIVYGNIKEQTLANLWDSKLSLVVRNRLQNISGACASCRNFTATCFSCLSRSTVDLQESLNQGCLKTVGCHIFGPTK